MLQLQLQAWLKRALNAAHALQSLHALQCNHGGLNPHTLHFLADGSVRLRPPANPSPLSLEQLRYVAPEQASRLTPADARSDLYSLGLILYEWLLERPAFTSQDPLQLAYQKIAMLPASPHQINPQLPQPLSELVMRLLAKPPDARYGSALGLADDLQHCLQQWESQGHLEPFALGSTDQQALFMLPQRLYGRGAATVTLVQLWRRVAHGGLQLCLVGGAAGMGKTSLVRALRDTVLGSGGMLLEGRFSLAERNVAHTALIDALRKLLRQLLAGTQSELLRWRAQLQTCLAERMPLALQLLPELEWICGTQISAGDADDSAEQRHAVLLDLLSMFTGADRPLLLFLDDLHAADMASIAFIHALLRDRRASHLLLVGTYLEEGASVAAPVARLRKALTKDAIAVTDIHLQPLDSQELAALIDDTCFRVHGLQALAVRAMQQTHGNPQQVLHYLSQQVQQGHLRYDRPSRRWCWTEGSTPIDHSAALAAMWWHD